MKSLFDYATDYIHLRRSLGYKMKDEKRLLDQFIRVMSESGSDVITSSLAVQWAMLPKNVQSSHWRRRLTIVRLFTQYLSTFEPAHEIPKSGLLKSTSKRTTPYVYSDIQVLQLLKTCLDIPTKGLRHLTYYTFFGLLIVTGCRIGELVRLKQREVNFKRSLLTICNSKNGESRILPMHSTVCHQLRQYATARDKFHVGRDIDSFFVSEKGTSLTINGIEVFFTRLSKKMGWRQPTDSYGPRIHDFRHHFAIKTVIQWYQAEQDVNQLMPLLSTYLGHKKPSDTYWYLTNVPELMALAASKLEIMERLP